MDYRELNKHTIKDKYPVSLIEKQLKELHGSTVYTKIDLRSSYHQIKMHLLDVHKIIFKTNSGHYEFLVMPFGLPNSPFAFQSLMNNMLRPYLRRFVLVFFDDILVYSATMEEHTRHLQIVLELLKNHTLYAKYSKCSFAGSQVEYLGYMLYRGIHRSKENQGSFGMANI